MSKNMNVDHGDVNVNIRITGRSFITGCSILALSLFASTCFMCRAILKASGRYTPLWSDYIVMTLQDLKEREEVRQWYEENLLKNQ